MNLVDATILSLMERQGNKDNPMAYVSLACDKLFAM